MQWQSWLRTKLMYTLRPRQNGRHFADDNLKCTFLNENVWIPIEILLKFVPKGPIDNIPALVQIMAWRRPGDKPLSEPMMVSLPTHICVIWSQWVNDMLVLMQQQLKIYNRKQYHCTEEHIIFNITGHDFVIWQHFYPIAHYYFRRVNRILPLFARIWTQSTSSCIPG